MHIVAVIPARGGSRGIPLKNLREVAGKPLIEACLAAEPVDRTVVSTDHEGIAQVAREFGAEVPFMRPKELAGDEVTLDPVIYHAVTTLEAQDGRHIDIVLTVQPTRPLLKATTIDGAVRALLDGGWDSVTSVRERVNRQQLQPLYYETGAVFASRREIITPDNRLGTNIGHVVNSEEESVDIDTELDLHLVEFLITNGFHDNEQ